MAWTLNSKDLGNIQKENHRKIANLQIFPLPQQDSDATEVTDFSGPQREITIEGKLTGTDTATLQTAIRNFDKISGTGTPIITGTQNSSVVFSSEVFGNFNVKVDELDWDYDTEKGPLVVAYTMRMVQSS
jgi:hypothetical protein